MFSYTKRSFFALMKKKNSSKKAERDEQYQTACLKVDNFFKELHAINADLKEVTDYNSTIPYPNKRKLTIIGDLTVIQKEISNIIETINKLEDTFGLRKLEFDMNTDWPSYKTSVILEKCHQIESFFRCYDLSLIKIKLKTTCQAKKQETIMKKEEDKQFFKDQHEALSYMD